ncbi:hypothetical protein OG596_38940 (plasmid) [Streptomyces sp. NBC_01102]|jgi:hypothetical protein|uniref:hypothetical protein n=1 Tax=Streptomyces TaxID=1883 RepID=UPI00190CA792|nr:MULTISPECIES: hypothetical protein [unclassified Streptomyces]WSS59708.1 hypothetical protein OG543_30225 [Streptomyces sp. NBC_01178]WSU71347.1 hypothetical protein OG596_38940 [Streptomyces sp. NBC_01102]MBK3557241.1 hypothetical protein [Streptomyces sp. MBT56]MBK3601837.1 hypothetical protein [Streptomyces sp. MBT54]MBK3616040.1 hypothetical protein [Streptomyces sp. MBT98]
MAGIFARMVSPLRRIDADPDKLVEEAYWLLKEAEKNHGVWPAMTAYTGMATVKVQIAQYLKEHRDA